MYSPIEWTYLNISSEKVNNLLLSANYFENKKNCTEKVHFEIFYTKILNEFILLATTNENLKNLTILSLPLLTKI